MAYFNCHSNASADAIVTTFTNASAVVLIVVVVVVVVRSRVISSYPNCYGQC